MKYRVIITEQSSVETEANSTEEALKNVDDGNYTDEQYIGIISKHLDEE